ncbi:unnamed protein product [Closterium sp. NIES-65]|nr:unnamed protein product [Closterium sp. NIES-65]
MRRVAPPRSMRANAAARLLLCAAVALATAADCSFSSANHPLPRQQAPKRRVPPLARPIRAQRSLLKHAATAAAANSEHTGGGAAPRPVALEATQPIGLQVHAGLPHAQTPIHECKAAWGAWEGNSNGTTACSAWPGVTCSPNGLVIALDSKAVAVDGSAAIPASITNLAALQYLDLTNNQLVGPIPSLASLSRLTLLYVPRLHRGPFSALRCFSPLHPTILFGLFCSVLKELMFHSAASLHVWHGRLHVWTLSSLTNTTGEIPREIRYLTALTALNVIGDEPRRQGLLSDDISHLTALTSLFLSGNNLEGYVPKSFSSLLNLQHLAALSAPFHCRDLTHNYLSGSIPRAFTTNIQSIPTPLCPAFLHSLPASHKIAPLLSALIYLPGSIRLSPSLHAATLSACPAGRPTCVCRQLSSNEFTGGIPGTFTRLTAMNVLYASPPWD